MSKMRVVGGLRDLRREVLQTACIVTGEFAQEGEALVPAIVQVEEKSGRKYSISGMVQRYIVGCAAGRLDTEGRKVLSVSSKDVTVAIRENKSGVLFMDGTVNGNKAEGWMTADDLVSAKEVERRQSNKEVNRLRPDQARNINERNAEVMDRWAAIRKMRENARQMRLKKAKRATA
jgi:hypothetical protein